ncbi:MAG: putative Ig domain-containing protein [Actinomycetaceae bacterium]|nr:putative Ig domain-containing protein [Actinomycetaceae bacterium]
MKTTSILGAATAALLTAGFTFGVSAVAIAAPEDIVPDANLRACLSTALPKGTEITEASIATLKNINCSNKDIKSIEGLQSATGATSVNIGHNRELTDFSPLTDLTQLTMVFAQYTSPTDLEWAKNLENLTDLQLNFGHVNGDEDTALLTDLSPIANLTNLEELTINWAYVSQDQVQHLAALTKMKKLALSGNNIDDAAALVALPDVTSMILHYNKIKDFTGLKAKGYSFLNLTSQRVVGETWFVPAGATSYTYTADPVADGLKTPLSTEPETQTVEWTPTWSWYTTGPVAATTETIRVNGTPSPAQAWWVQHPVEYVDFTNVAPAAANQGTAFAFTPELDTPEFTKGAADGFKVSPDTPLPAGLTLDPKTGRISGTPTAVGTTAITIIAKDPQGNEISKTYTLQIGAALPATPTTPGGPAAPVPVTGGTVTTPDATTTTPPVAGATTLPAPAAPAGTPADGAAAVGGAQPPVAGVSAVQGTNPATAAAPALAQTGSVAGLVGGLAVLALALASVLAIAAARKPRRAAHAAR